MAALRVGAAATLDAPPDAVYAVLADYRDGHPRILPPASFSDLEVEQGGVGAGTVVRFAVRLGGQTRRVRAAITEPEPDRVLAETDLDTGAVTRFTVEPVEGGRRAHVTIGTTWTTPGLRGLVERLLAPPLLRRIYVEELGRLAEVAAAHARA